MAARSSVTAGIVLLLTVAIVMVMTPRLQLEKIEQRLLTLERQIHDIQMRNGKVQHSIKAVHQRLHEENERVDKTERSFYTIEKSMEYLHDAIMALGFLAYPV